MTGHELSRLWTCQRVAGCGKQGSGLEWRQLWDIFQKVNWSALGRDLMYTAVQPTRREDCGHNLLPLSAPHRLTKGVWNEVVYQFHPSTTVQNGECRPHIAQKQWAGNWAPMIIVAQTGPPFLPEPPEREKWAQTPHQLQETGRSAKPAGQDY